MVRTFGGEKVSTKGVFSSENSSTSTGRKEVWYIPKSLFQGEKKETHIYTKEPSNPFALVYRFWPRILHEYSSTPPELKWSVGIDFGQGGIAQNRLSSEHLTRYARQCFIQERKGHTNLRKILGTLAGCPWDARRDKQGSTGRPRHFLRLTLEKWTEKGIFAGTQAGCPRDTGHPGGFQKFYHWGQKYYIT